MQFVSEPFFEQWLSGLCTDTGPSPSSNGPSRRRATVHQRLSRSFRQDPIPRRLEVHLIPLIHCLASYVYAYVGHLENTTWKMFIESVAYRHS